VFDLFFRELFRHRPACLHRRIESGNLASTGPSNNSTGPAPSPQADV
jgi:hypothetical protein